MELTVFGLWSSFSQLETYKSIKSVWMHLFALIFTCSDDDTIESHRHSQADIVCGPLCNAFYLIVHSKQWQLIVCLTFIMTIDVENSLLNKEMRLTICCHNYKIDIRYWIIAVISIVDLTWLQLYTWWSEQVQILSNAMTIWFKSIFPLEIDSFESTREIKSFCL